jgi:hypothetical protein
MLFVVPASLVADSLNKWGLLNVAFGIQILNIDIWMVDTLVVENDDMSPTN